MNRKTNASVLPLLLRRKWAIILWGLGGSVASLVLAQVIPFRYASEGSLVIENREPNIPDCRSNQNADGCDQFTRLNRESGS
jgi:uncharacterized protein involved in exopolysaccharide biosynthesis